MNHLIHITKADGTTQLFEEDKLVSSLKRVGASSEVIDDIVDEVEKEMWDGIPTEDIYRRAFELLRKHSAPVAVKYSIRRGMFELGPDGFPFEKFVARIFKVWGYESITDQTLTGTCVEHEVDVVAWKENELAMAEVKFHNDFGLKSDLKVSLYVKARFDDLAETTFEYGGLKRKLTDRFLVTNTKFTEAAIQYGTCKGLKMISWNYPSDKSLHKIIENYGLYPITCLVSISHQQKKDLIALGILACPDIAANPDVLKAVGIHPEAAKVVLAEVEMIKRLAIK
jgi:hypothetical protein